jgi:predicted aspartyl protease
MIVGTISADGIPIIILSIAGREWPAIIDTGFNGDLELPEDLRTTLNPRHVGRVTSALAGGQRIEEDVYIVAFPFDGQILQAEATFVADSHILIGTHLLRHYQLHLDFVAQTVQLTRKS